MSLVTATVLFYRSLVTQLAAPKIPEGERVDFDVCSFKWSIWWNNCMITAAENTLNNLCVHWFR